jgi:hypothetical protein
MLFIIYIALDLSNSTRSFVIDDYTAFVVTFAYPILDLMLFLPSMIILISIRKDDLQSIPWIILSLSIN